MTAIQPDIAHPAIPGHTPNGHTPASAEPAVERPASSLVNTRLFNLFEKIVVDTPRALLVLSYLGIIAALVAFIGYSLYHSLLFCADIWHGDEASATIGLLSGLDGIMIANGVYLIAAGSYIVYVKDRLEDSTFTSHSQRPQALRHLSPGTLKEKMAASLIGVSSVNLLQILINVGVGVGHEHIDWITFTVKVGIHIVLLAGLVIFARVNQQEEQEHAAAGGRPAH